MALVRVFGGPHQVHFEEYMHAVTAIKSLQKPCKIGLELTQKDLEVYRNLLQSDVQTAFNDHDSLKKEVCSITDIKERTNFSSLLYNLGIVNECIKGGHTIIPLDSSELSGQHAKLANKHAYAYSHTRYHDPKYSLVRENKNSIKQINRTSILGLRRSKYMLEKIIQDLPELVVVGSFHAGDLQNAGIKNVSGALTRDMEEKKMSPRVRRQKALLEFQLRQLARELKVNTGKK